MVSNQIKTIMIPHKHDYILRLKKALEKENIIVSLLPPFHYATPYNFLKVLFLRLFGYRIIHIHWVYIFPFSFLMKMFFGFAKKIGYKIVWTVHNVLPHESNEKDIEKTKWFYNNVDFRFVNYKSNIKKLKRELGVNTRENVEIIFHPVFDSYPNNISREESRKKLSISLDKKVVLGFGLIRKYKGMDLLAQAIKHLDNEYYGIIAGENRDSELVKELEKYATEVGNLKLVPHKIPNENVQLFFNACDVVVMPYYDVTTSGVVLLAYSFGKPVITTRVGGLHEVVEDKKTGFLIEPNNLEMLIDSIEEIFNVDYTKMGENAKKLAYEKFTWEVLGEKTRKIYDQVLLDETR